MLISLIAQVLSIIVINSISAHVYDARVRFQWNYMNYTWSSSQAHDQAILNGSYIPEHNVVSGVKIWKDRIYLTVPRLKKGVPSTLNFVPLDSPNSSPLLQAYPSWSMQREDDCNSFQLVQSMEIDPLGRMWVISNGRTELRSNESRSICPSRLVILDLENNGEILMNYIFPDDVVQKESVYLNDIVVDHEDGGFAYITDNDSKHPGIIVFSLWQRRSWKVSHQSMEVQEEAIMMSVNGTSFKNKSPVNGIALSQASGSRRFLYYFPISSFKLFAVPTWVLKRGNRNINRFVAEVGQKPSQSGGMIMSSTGILYFGLLGEDAVSSWDTTSPPFTDNQRIVIQDHELSQYPDSFAVDERGQLWYTSNRLQVFRTDSVDLDQINIRLIVTNIGAKSYQYLQDGRAPKLPKIKDRTRQKDSMRLL